MAKVMTQNAAPGLGIDADLARKLLRDMVLIRRFERRRRRRTRSGKIGGFLHSRSARRRWPPAHLGAPRDDYAISTYREHGHCLIKGSDPRRVMAELFGRSTAQQGQGCSMHLFDKEHNFLGGHAIVGAHLPIAAASALPSSTAGGPGDRCYFGDGAVPEGEFHGGPEPRGL